MELRLNHLAAGERKVSSPKRERSMKGRRLTRSNQLHHHQQLLESIARANCGGDGGGGRIVCHEGGPGVVRMKVLVKKQDLKQMLELLGDGKLQSSSSFRSSTELPSSLTFSNVEQRLNLLRRKQASRGNGGKGCRVSSSRPWIPALQSIPEEL
ncbi:hypothetical protein LINPERHAP2_LOCUS8384 [Linum perenne]